MSRLRRSLLASLALLVLCLGAGTARADTFTYTFESPQFTFGEATPLLNRAPNVGSSAFRTDFTSSPNANGFQVLNFIPNPLFMGNSLAAPLGANTLTLSFNSPVNSVQFVFAINQRAAGAPGQITLTSLVGSASMNAGDPAVIGGEFQGGVFSFSSPTPFSTLQLNAFTSAGAPIEFAIDNLTLSTAAVPEPATMLLLGTGLAGVVGAARRRRKGVNS